MAARQGDFAISFPLDLGMDNTASDTAVQPFGPGAALVASTNTRLSKVRGLPVKAPGTTTPNDPSSPHSGATACGGVVPCGHVSSSLVMRQRRYGAQRVAGTALSQLDCPLPGTPGVGAYWPADVSRAGAVPGGGQYVAPAMCMLDEQIWLASVRRNDIGTGLGIFVVVLGADGEVVAALEQVLSIAGTAATPPWVGLTSHGANGVRLWYQDGAGTGVKLSTLTVSNGDVTATAGVTMYTPTASGLRTYDVTAHGTAYAWLLTISAAAVGDIALTKVDIATNTVVATRTTSVTTTTGSYLSVKSASMSAGDRVAVMVALAAGTCTELLFDGSSMAAALHTFTGRMLLGEPVCGFYRSGATEYVCYGVTDLSVSIGAAFPATGGSYFEARTVDATGTLSATVSLPWLAFVSKFEHHSPAAGEIYPVFAAQPGWTSDGGQYFATNKEFCADPAVHVYRIDLPYGGAVYGAPSGVSCIGRFGVDRAAVYPPRIPGSTAGIRYNSDVLWCDGDKIGLVYAENPSAYAEINFPCRFVELDMTARQPRYAIGADGVAIIAAAMPMEWDGSTLAECCAPHMPNLAIATTGGSGLNIAAGTYLVSAVVTWRDSAGVLHRSMPAIVRSETTAGGTAWVIQVSAHLLVHDGAVQDSYEVEIYMSLAGGSVLYRLQQMAPTTITALYWEFANVSTPAASDVTPPIYTTGAAGFPLPAQAPPCMYDVAVVGNRAWMIHGEYRLELWPSKPKERTPRLGSVAYEWSSELPVQLPTAAGKAMALVEEGGSLMVLCSNGAWVVTGPGPGAALTDSGSFNTPEQVSDIGCSSRDSVIRTPAGVMFRSGTRFAVVGQQGVRLVDEIDASALGTLVPVLLRDTQEVVWFSSSGVHMVYNYAVGRWSKWDSNVAPAVVAGALDPVSGLVNLVASSDSTVRQMDPSGSSSTAQMSFQTGHMVIGGPQDDNVVNDIVIQAKSNGSHGLTVTIQEDYGQRDSTTRTFSAAEIAACTVNGQYTVCVSPKNASMRTCKVTITETGATGDAFRPLSVTVIGTKNPGTKRDAVKAAGRK